MTAAEAAWTITLFVGASLITALAVLAWPAVQSLLTYDRGPLS